MLRRFRRGRRKKNQDAATASSTSSQHVPEKSPASATGVSSSAAATTTTTTTTPPIKHARRRQRGTPSTVASNSPQSPTRSGREPIVMTPDMDSYNLLNDMQVQLESKIPELPIVPASTLLSSSSSMMVTAPTTRTMAGKTFARRSRRNPRSLSSSSRSLPPATTDEADLGCLPRSRSVERNPTNQPNASRAVGTGSKFWKGQPLTREYGPGKINNNDDQAAVAEEWNRITKEAANWDRKGTEHFEKGEYEQAFLCYEKALTLKRSTLKPTAPNDPDHQSSEASLLASVATSINNMTYLRQRSGQATADETMAAYLQSLQMKREILGPHHLSVGKTLNNIGSVFYLQREYTPALKAYLQALGIMGDQLGATHLDVGTVLSNIGDVYFAMGSKQDAKEHYRKALDVRWGALGPSDQKVVRLMEQLAFLETGKQPSKDDEELSDSENEEFVVADRLRHERFQQEVRVLQDELAEDMKFFDLLERKMAIDMVRDKTRMFRKMRQLTDLSMDDVVRMDLSESNYTENSEGDLSVATAPAISESTWRPAAQEQFRRARTLDDLPEGTSAALDGGFLADTNHMLPLAPSTESTTVPSSATTFLERTHAMSKEERAEALHLVRERLAVIRAAREEQERKKRQDDFNEIEEIVEEDDDDDDCEDDDDDDPDTQVDGETEGEENEEEYKIAEAAGWVPKSLPGTVS